MLKKGTFVKNKYLKFYVGSLLGAFASGINIVLDSVLSGNQLGETALTAVSIVAPLTFIIFFLSNISSSGYGVLYGQYNGEFNKKKSYMAAGQTIVSSLIIGILLAGVLIVLKEPFLKYYGCIGELYTDASAYYNWKIASALILPVSYALYYLVATDGDTINISISSIASILTNIILSTILCKLYGTAGLGMGSFYCTLVYIAICCLHLFKKTNSIHFIWGFNLKEFIQAAKLSSVFALSFLFVGVTDIVMNKVVLVSSGINMVAAYSVINLIFCFYESYNAPYAAADGLVVAFKGEKNNTGITNVMKITIKTTIVHGLVLSLILFIFAPWIPKLYGMQTKEIIEASVKATRWMALAAVPYGIAFVLESIYPAFGKLRLGLIVALLNDILLPLVLSIPFAYMFGFTGVCIGMAISNYFVLIVFTIYVIKKYGKKGYPLYLDDYNEETVSFDIIVSENSITEIRDLVKTEMNKHGFEIDNIEILIEELYKRIYEKNPGKKVMSECFLIFGKDYVRIIVRDDGVIFNFVDENNTVESLNAFTLNCLLEHVDNKEYILTTSFNRNGFVFRR